MSENSKIDKPLPQHIIMMVDKGNLVSAIKSLSDEEGISMDEAKDWIDYHDEQLQLKRQKQQEKIAKKQGIALNGEGTIVKRGTSNAELGAGNSWKWVLAALVVIIIGVTAFFTR